MRARQLPRRPRAGPAVPQPFAPAPCPPEIQTGMEAEPAACPPSCFPRPGGEAGRPTGGAVPARPGSSAATGPSFPNPFDSTRTSPSPLWAPRTPAGGRKPALRGSSAPLPPRLAHRELSVLPAPLLDWSATAHSPARQGRRTDSHPPVAARTPLTCGSGGSQQRTEQQQQQAQPAAPSHPPATLRAPPPLPHAWPVPPDTWTRRGRKARSGQHQPGGGRSRARPQATSPTPEGLWGCP